MQRSMKRTCALVVLLSTAAPAAGPSLLDGRPVVLDGGGKLLSWLTPQEGAYSAAATTAWDFLVRWPRVEPDGFKTYFEYPGFNGLELLPATWVHNPASLFAFLTDSGLSMYQYSGDPSALAFVQSLLDHELQHGLTPSGWSWSRVPFASTMPGTHDYSGADDVWACRQSGASTTGAACGQGDGIGAIEPDKVGVLGYWFLRAYQATGATRYLEAAIACADALASHVRPGSATQSPWPFRVLAQTDVVREDYGSNVIGPIELLDELVRLRLGQTARYRSARQVAWSWLMSVPMQDDHWGQYFEDIPIFPDPQVNENQNNPMETARYLMLHPGLDPDWRVHVPHLIAFVEQRFAIDAWGEKGSQFGANVISEQVADMAKMSCHTARYASINALWFARTGDAAAKEKAFRSFNWATYLNDGKGLVSAGVTAPGQDSGQGYWFSVYAEYIRQYMAGLAAIPEWAPPGENHLLASSSVVQAISYSSSGLSYRTFDADSIEVMRVVAAPEMVIAGGKRLLPGNLVGESYALQTLANGGYSLRVHHSGSGEIAVVLGRGGHHGCQTGGRDLLWALLGGLALLGRPAARRVRRNRSR
jgi:hypothetical protein